MIILKIEDAVVLPEIKIGAVKFATMREAVAESLLRHFGVEDLAFKVIDLGGLRTDGARGTQSKNDQKNCNPGESLETDLRHGLVPHNKPALAANVPTSAGNADFPRTRKQYHIEFRLV